MFSHVYNMHMTPIKRANNIWYLANSNFHSHLQPNPLSHSFIWSDLEYIMDMLFLLFHYGHCARYFIMVIVRVTSLWSLSVLLHYSHCPCYFVNKKIIFNLCTCPLSWYKHVYAPVTWCARMGNPRNSEKKWSPIS